jgi:transposase-like protein
MSTYPEAFRARMVQKLTAPGGPSATALAEEIGITQPTLSRWVREAARVPGMKSSNPQNSQKARRPQDWTAEEKMAAVAQASQLSEEEVGSFLRRNGLHRSHLERWRQQMLTGLEAPARRTKRSPESRQVTALQRELRRKDQALAETAALLVLKKKAAAIWGDEDDDTPPRRGK